MQTALPVSNLIRQARQGVLRRRVDEVARLVNLTDIDMARILNMSVRSLHGKAATERLSPATSERLLLLERLVQHGLSVFDGRADMLGRWLRTPLAELAYRDGADDATPAITFCVRDMGSFSEPEQTQTETVQIESPTGLVLQSPLAVLDTVSGFSLAEDVLGRIEWGIIG